MKSLKEQIIAATKNGKMAHQQVDDILKIVQEHKPEKTQYEMVQEFQKTFNSPCNYHPTVMPFCDSDENQTENVCSAVRWATTMARAESKRVGSEVMFRASLLLEEIEELLSAETIEDQLDALIDIHYLNTGNFVEMGIDPQEPFKIVHNANMSKVWPDGTVHLNEYGKVMKPDTFVKPEPLLANEIKRQQRGGYKAV